MKRLIFFGTALLFVSAASAATLGCDQITTLQQLIAQQSCQHLDKIFSNFQYSNDDVAQVVVQHQFSTSGDPTKDVHGWLFSKPGNWTVGFTLSYDIAIAPGFPAQRIFLVKDQENSGAIPNGTSITDTESVLAGDPPCCTQVRTLTVTGTSTGETMQTAFIPLATKIHTSSVFTPGGGSLVSYEQDWFQTAVPEPATFMLCGGALILAGWLGKRRRAA